MKALSITELLQITIKVKQTTCLKFAEMLKTLSDHLRLLFGRQGTRAVWYG